MNRHILALIAAIAFSPFTTAADKSSTVSCLEKSDVIYCLVTQAQERITQAPKDKDRAEAIATLLAAISRADYRNDELYQLATQKDNNVYSASISWQLLLAQQSYEVRVQGKSIDADDVSRASALATLIKRHSDGLDVISIIGVACDAKEGLRPEQNAAWGGLPDEQCSLSSADAVKLDNELNGFSVLVTPMIHAYRNERASLQQSLEKSLSLLGEYELVLSHPKLPKDQREGFRFLLFIGHVFNATALSVSGDTDSARRAIEMAQIHLKSMHRKTKSDPAITVSKAHLAWTMAMVGMKVEAIDFVKESLKRVDLNNKASVSDSVATIAACVETLTYLKR